MLHNVCASNNAADNCISEISTSTMPHKFSTETIVPPMEVMLKYEMASDKWLYLLQSSPNHLLCSHYPSVCVSASVSYCDTSGDIVNRNS